MRARFVLPAVYLAVALLAWLDFVRTNPDGLANIGLMLVTLPATLLGLLLTWMSGGTEFVLIPSRLGYYTAHAVYFWPAALATALLLYWLGGAFGKSR